jgi:hypothetical protein
MVPPATTHRGSLLRLSWVTGDKAIIIECYEATPCVTPSIPCFHDCKAGSRVEPEIGLPHRPHANSEPGPKPPPLAYFSLFIRFSLLNHHRHSLFSCFLHLAVSFTFIFRAIAPPPPAAYTLKFSTLPFAVHATLPPPLPPLPASTPPTSPRYHHRHRRLLTPHALAHAYSLFSHSPSPSPRLRLRRAALCLVHR